ncbi:YbhB/YbcL family Raf kinase inhibitor-like protein [Apibacter sp. HY039]|uniref:YbhB/YbcL family Raf kinase inhibitor-like protein n=1 Tax=Apibacter sp. HY039 TaxID=2501476 RepID=UPI000FEB76BA|nr:YbhB/YbcL family Raf kinase inhibitor-like protein [Apibacter sp. HY039]
MKKVFFILITCAYCSIQAQNFTLKSNTLQGQAESNLMFNGMGCNGENMSPQLFWENVPIQTQSFAITIFDPDAPTGSGWWHWVAYNIPSDIREMKANAGNITKKIAPLGTIQSKTDYGTYGYGGPCPPTGDRPHQYIITIYALDTPLLDLDKDASPALVGFYLQQHTIQKASLIFYSQR